MRDSLKLQKVNEVYLRVVSEPSVIQELSDHLTFMVPGAKFSPAFKNKFWDGKIRLLNSLTGLTYTGLVKEISEFAASRNYDLEIDPELVPQKINNPWDFQLKIEPRDYQKKTFQSAINRQRGVFISPTASGKSLIIFALTSFYNFEKQKVLVIVPTISLVLQMKKDFEDYTDRKLGIHCITAGVYKDTDDPIVISTWQSIYKMPKQWFKQFGCVIGDEVHLFKATSLKSIMEKLVDCRYRFGFTGTLDGSLTNKITLEGLFGPVKQVTTTTELMDQGHVAELKIKALVLQYSKETKQPYLDLRKKLGKNFGYKDEIASIVSNPKRNKFLRNLCLSLEGNTLLLFQYVEKHGKILYDMIRDKDPDRKVFFVHGGVEGDDRERIRGIVETESSAIIVASYGTFSTGINIRNLHNVILGSPSKSRVRILQSIGRGLRIGDSKNEMTLYDIADDLRINNRPNFTLEHFMERINIYDSEGFEYKIFNMEI